MELTPLLYLLWIGGFSLQAVLAVRMYGMNLNRQLPVFFVYLIFHLFRTALLFPLRYNVKAYFVAYWLTAVPDDILAIAVVHELYNAVLLRYEGLRALARLMFRWALAILLLLAVISAATPYSSDFDRLMSGLLFFDRGATVVQLGLLLFLFAFASLMRLSWRHYVLGFVLCFALFASADVVLLTLTLNGGAMALKIYSPLKTAAFNCCVLTWVAFLFGRDRMDIPNRPPGQQLEYWNRALMEFLGQ